jgi:type II secretory pathway pseudopilin PulG
MADVKTRERDASLSSDPATLAVAPEAEITQDQGESKESLLEAVQKAVPELQEGAQEEVSSDERASPAQLARDKADDDSDVPDEVTQEELAKVSKTAQRKISKLSKQRQRLAGEVERLKALEPDAQAAIQVTQYLTKADISRDDFVMGLELMAAMRRGDFRTFYEGVKPYMRLCEEYLGIALPPDLQQQVQQGQMTTQAAMQFSKERMDRAMAQTNAAKQHQMMQQYQQTTTTQLEQQRLQNLANSVAVTVDHWEKQIARTDPSYMSVKRAAVNEVMWAVVKEQGPPQSAEHGLAIAKEAYRRVNAHFARLGPQRAPTYRTPSSTGRTAGVTPEPKNLMEVVKFAREGASRL